MGWKFLFRICDIALASQTKTPDPLKRLSLLISDESYVRVRFGLALLDESDDLPKRCFVLLISRALANNVQSSIKAGA